MKLELDIEQTSSQLFFKEKTFSLWNAEDAPILVGIGIQTPENIGGLIRLAGTIGCRELLIVTDDLNNHKSGKIKKMATTAYSKVNWRFVEYSNWEKLIPSDYEIIALETTPKSEMIYSLKLTSKTAFVVGNERYGIDINNLNLCTKHAFIPLTGSVKSLNVVQAASVALFELLRQQLTL